MKAIAGTTGRSVQQIKRDVAEKGDLGIVAEVCVVPRVYKEVGGHSL